MTTKTNGAEGGTNATTVTTGNSGGTSGNAFDVVSFPSGNVTFDTASAVHGSLGYKFAPASGSQAILRHNGFSSLTGAGRFYVKSITLPPSSEALLAVATVGDANILQVQLTPSGQYQILNSAFGFVANTTATFVAGDRVELSWTIATTTTGSYVLKLFRGDSTSAVETLTASNVNFGSTAWAYAQYGKSSTSTWVGPFGLDDLYAQDGTTTLPGPASAPTPTANAGPAQTNVEPYSTVTLDGTGSTPPGGSSITGYAWTQAAGTTVTLAGATTAHPTFTAPASVAGGTLTFSLVVTSTGAVSSPAATVNVTVLPHTIFRLDGGGPTPLLVVRL